MFHPDAILIHRGVRAYYGREEIEKAQEQFCQMGLKFDSKTTFLAEAGNGEYLMRRGTFTVPNNPKNFDFEHVYKKVDGQYLMLYDIFSYE